MMRLVSPRAVAAGCGLILLANAAILGATAWNRRGEPSARLVLGERELAVPEFREKENSGLFLSLVPTDRTPVLLLRTLLRKRMEIPRVEHEWLDRDKLRELGFDVALDPADPEAAEHYGRMMSRRAHVVLEIDGEGWRAWADRREQKLRRLREQGGDADTEAAIKLELATRSRLFPVDAGNDADELRRRYPDRDRHAVVEAMIRPRIRHRDDDTPWLSGSVSRLLVGSVNVPLRLRHRLEPYLPTETRGERFDRDRAEGDTGWPVPDPPRYRAVVEFGRRLEPWLVRVEPTAGR